MSDSPAPTLQAMLVHLSEVGSDWFVFGIALGVPISKLRDIETMHSKEGAMRCIVDVAQYWMDATPDTSWRHVGAALEQVGLLRLASIIKLKYLWDDTPNAWSHVSPEASKEQQLQLRLAAVLQESQQKDQQLSDVSMKMHSYKANYEQQLILQQQLQSQLAIVQQESQQKDQKVSDISTKMQFYKEKYEQQKKELEILQQKVIQARLLLDEAVQQDEIGSGRTSHRVPTTDRDPLQSAPEIKHLHNKVAAKALHKWKRLGTQLDIDFSKLTSIEEKHMNSFDCYAEIFQLWKSKGDPPYTWRTIIDALKAPSVEETELATELQEWLQHT